MFLVYQDDANYAMQIHNDNNVPDDLNISVFEDSEEVFKVLNLLCAEFHITSKIFTQDEWDLISSDVVEGEFQDVNSKRK